MRPESSAADPAVVLASGPVAGAGAGAGDPAVAIPRLTLGARMHLRWPRVALHPLAGRVALGVLVLGAFLVVAFTSSGPTALVARSVQTFPNWEAGPLHGLFADLNVRNSTALDYGLSVVLLVMGLAYLVALSAVRTLSMRVIVLCVVALHAVLLMGPPLTLTDVFNYLGYARLGGLHHLNPYNHVIQAELHDPIYRFTTWHNLSSPYGPLFTAASYLISGLPLAVAYWILKVVTVLASLTFVALVWKCARLLGRDPRFAVLFVAANPIYLMFAVAGFHNDFFMLIPSTAAIALLLARRDRSAGIAVMVAVAVKFTAILLLPFLLIAVKPTRRRVNLLVGAALAAVPLATMYLALFGFTLPNLADQSTLLTPWSIPNVLGLILGVGGGTPGLFRIANVLLLIVTALLLRRRRDWLSDAGWSTLALIASLAWLVPWYVIWLLPLAAIGTSLRLRRVALAFTAYLVIGFAPITGTVLSKVGVNLMNSPAGQASQTLQHKLSG
jgi:Glycosyltransferase family 87